MSIDKQFHGDLEATSKGQMLAAGTDIKDSAGYVAIERVIGTLHGQSGAFALQHSGTMTRGALQLTVTVVPDSGTGQLVGLAGNMTINVKAMLALTATQPHNAAHSTMKSARTSGIYRQFLYPTRAARVGTSRRDTRSDGDEPS